MVWISNGAQWSKQARKQSIFDISNWNLEIIQIYCSHLYLTYTLYKHSVKCVKIVICVFINGLYDTMSLHCNGYIDSDRQMRVIIHLLILHLQTIQIGCCRLYLISTWRKHVLWGIWEVCKSGNCFKDNIGIIRGQEVFIGK